MPAFPLFVNVEKKTCLVFGGGRVALRKIRTLLNFGMYIKVCAIQCCEELCQLIDGGIVENVRWQDGEKLLENQTLLKEIDMVIAATDDRMHNHHISILCQQNDVWVNSATSAEDSTFLFPSTVIRGDMVVGISSSGHTPSLTKYVRRQVEACMPVWYDDLEERLSEVRKFGELSLETQNQRQKFMEQMTAYGLLHEGEIPESAVLEILNALKGQ